MKAAIVLVAAAALAGCGQSEGPPTKSAKATANAAAAAPKRPTYCFFKDALTKGWAASLDPAGNVSVTGKLKVEDRRYRGDFIQNEVAGDKARAWFALVPNTGYAQPDNWWDVSLTIPGSSGVASVTVMCGTKPVAELKVKRV